MARTNRVIKKDKIIEIFDSGNMEELEKYLSLFPLDKVASAMLEISPELLTIIFKKLPEETSSELFLMFPPEIQNYLVENISDFEFKDISEEILQNDSVETNVNEKVFNEIILKAESEVRHDKLIDIIDKVENKNFTAIKPILAKMEPIDIADLFNEIDDEKVVILFRLLPKDLANDVFVDMDLIAQETLIRTITDAELETIVNDLFSDDTADIVEEMPSNMVRRMLKVASPETRDSVNKLLGFPKDSAGSIMTPECVTFRMHYTVDEALAKIRRQARDKETIYTCYVTDEEKHLIGTVTAQDLILHNPTEIIKDFMDDNVICAHTLTDKEDVSKLLSRYDLLAIPIVDSENRINGIVTVDDAIDVIQDEATEDISKISAILPSSKPYLQTNVFKIFANRIPWLLVLLISATFTGLIINIYEDSLSKISTLLIACMPMLMGAGGNAGSQSSVTVIQSLALNEISFKDIFKIIWKELRVALVVSTVLAVACFAKLQLIDNLIFGYDYTIKISLVVSASLLLTICAAKMVGCILPLVAKKCKLDPAVVASPFITTIIDILSLIIFCKLSIALL